MSFMKNLLLTFLLLCFVSPAFGAVEPPQWSEFCNPNYINAEYKQDNTLPRWKSNLLYFSIVGIPFYRADIDKYNEIKNNNYWVDRHEKFNQKIEACQNIKSDNELMYKYLSIRQDEIAENNRLDSEQLRLQQNAMVARQNWQYTNMQSSINNAQIQQRFNSMYH
jgi:hypothetical protein